MSEVSQEYNALYDEIGLAVKDAVVGKAITQNVLGNIEKYANAIRHFHFIQGLPKIINELQEGYDNAQGILPDVKHLCKKYREELINSIGRTAVIPTNIRQDTPIEEFIARGMLHEALGDFPELKTNLKTNITRLDELRQKMEEEFNEKNNSNSV